MLELPGASDSPLPCTSPCSSYPFSFPLLSLFLALSPSRPPPPLPFLVVLLPPPSPFSAPLPPFVCLTQAQHLVPRPACQRTPLRQALLAIDRSIAKCFAYCFPPRTIAIVGKKCPLVTKNSDERPPFLLVLSPSSLSFPLPPCPPLSSSPFSAPLPPFVCSAQAQLPAPRPACQRTGKNNTLSL